VLADPEGNKFCVLSATDRPQTVEINRRRQGSRR